MSNVVPGDDDVGQDALFTMVPSSSGVSTAVFNLYVGQAPQGSDESGFDGFSDDARDARCDLTRDFGFVAMSGSGFPMTMRARQTLEPAPITTAQTEPTTGDAESPSAPAATLTFARWQQDHAQLSDLSASGNPDADLLDNLLEYALGTLPDSGTSGSGNFHLAVSPAGEVEALYSRPNDGRMDIRYLLEGSTDGQSWFALPLAPVTSFDSNGTQVRRYSGLEAQSAFAGHSRGMVRLTVNLDANLDGTPEATSASPTLAWSRETFGVGTRTFSMPLVTPELFAGKLHGIENNAILRIQAQGLAAKVVEGTAHYADILTGPHSGHRLHLKSITDTTLQVATEHDQTTLKVLPASLVNEQIAIRSYWKLDTLLPGDLFGSSDAGDRVMFMDRTSRQFVLYHLETSSDGSRVWRNQENNAEQRVVSPSEALMVQVRHTEATVLLMGQVLPALPVYPIEAGTQFLAMPGWADQNLPDTHGLTSAGTATEATRLRLWKPDFETVTSGYAQYYLQRDGTANRWTAEGQKGTDLTTPTIPAFRGVFLISPTAHPNWKWQ